METLFEILSFILSLVLVIAVLQLFGIKSRLQRLIDLKEREMAVEADRHPVHDSREREGPRPFGVAG